PSGGSVSGEKSKPTVEAVTASRPRPNSGVRAIGSLGSRSGAEVTDGRCRGGLGGSASASPVRGAVAPAVAGSSEPSGWAKTSDGRRGPPDGTSGPVSNRAPVANDADGDGVPPVAVG